MPTTNCLDGVYICPISGDRKASAGGDDDLRHGEVLPRQNRRRQNVHEHRASYKTSNTVLTPRYIFNRFVTGFAADYFPIVRKAFDFAACTLCQVVEGVIMKRQFVTCLFTQVLLTEHPVEDEFTNDS